MRVVEERLSGSGVVEAPAGEERLPASADIAIDQADAPEQRRRIDALQRDVDPRRVEIVVEEGERARHRERLEREQRFVPAEVAGKAVRAAAIVRRFARAPLGTPLRHPGTAFVVAGLHLHHVRDGVDRPRHAGLGSERSPPGRFRLGVAPGFLEAERVQCQHVRMKRVVFGPADGERCDAIEELHGVAAVEVEQVRPLQRERVARVRAQELAPGIAGAGPVAGGETRRARLGAHARERCRRRRPSAERRRAACALRRLATAP